MKYLKLVCLFLALSLSACSTSISKKLYTKTIVPLPAGEKVIVLTKEEVLPEGVQLIGEVKIGDSGFTTDCGFMKVINDAKATAVSSGANIIKLTEVKEPTALGSTCYRIKAKMYRFESEESKAKYVLEDKEKNKSSLPEDADYAVLYFYRPGTNGPLLNYVVRDENDEIIGKLVPKSKFEYKTTVLGKRTFYIQLETKETIVLEVEKGKEYYFYTSVRAGVAFGRPVVNLVENKFGKKEYDKVIKVATFTPEKKK